MLRKILQHPGLHHQQDVIDICRPLQKLNISYFAHVKIDNNKQFSAISNNAAFTEHYLRKKYFNADINASPDMFGEYILWDAMEYDGETAIMLQEAKEMGHQHNFTICEKNNNGIDFYHFASNLQSNYINQIYLTNLDLLKLFIPYFKEKIATSSTLSKAYDLKFSPDYDTAEYKVKSYHDSSSLQQLRFEFQNSICKTKEHFQRSVLIHKDNSEVIKLTFQLSKCLELLIKGLSAKQIAQKLEISHRTVEHHFEKIRKILGCRNNKELIAVYAMQLFESKKT